MSLTRRMGLIEADRVESVLKNIDQSTVRVTGISLFHLWMGGSIAASVALFVSGRKCAGIFVGLWPATFQALKSASER